MVDVRFEVSAKELPPLSTVVVLFVEADMRPPDDVTPDAAGMLGEPGGLGVVEDDDVAGTDDAGQVVGAGAERSLVETVLVVAQRASVTEAAVEVIVDPLRQGEELLVRVDDEPTGVDPDATDVPEQDVQHLRHPTAGGGRVDVDHRPAVELPKGLARGDHRECVGALGADDLCELQRIAGVDRHFLHR